jgi:hypothetical protein
MKSAPRSARRDGGRDAGPDATRWRVWLLYGGIALAAAVFIRLEVGRSSDAGVTGPPPQPTARARTAAEPIVLAGKGSQTSSPFYLAGVTYRSVWSAWGEAAEFPPCTHSVRLLAVDPANTALFDLANHVQVPATGASQSRDVSNLKPGDYYLDVYSECAWQIALNPT